MSTGLLNRGTGSVTRRRQRYEPQDGPEALADEHRFLKPANQVQFLADPVLSFFDNVGAIKTREPERGRRGFDNHTGLLGTSEPSRL